MVSALIHAWGFEGFMLHLPAESLVADPLLAKEFRRFEMRREQVTVELCTSHAGPW